MAVVEFAPLRIPLHRRLETAAVALYYYSFFFGALLGFLIIIGLLYTSLYPIALLYLAWAYLFDYGTPSHGGRRSKFMRGLRVWKYFRDYFPIQLVKTTELDPSKHYVFGYHPHGILCAGAFCNFATEATNFSEVFPGITPHLLPLMALFKPPLFRDYIMSSGMCDVTHDSCEYILQNKGPGNSIVIVVGGASEALDAHPGTNVLTLKARYGFIKLAIRNGASLVPVYAFGENDVFNQVSNPRGSMLRRIQTKIQKTVAFAPVLFYGRGIFQYTFGLLPHRKPIHVVVGSPIEVEKNENPSRDEVQRVHDLYEDKLVKLFEDNKEKYGLKKEDKLEIL
ncbi:predicted protein [Nematostella vectensis]|uniref:Acyltransferase n=1 Tax=Nematostella vectensis TaxID=45351 RepID=A7SD32_NEMVE|nr:2-acylglycerol O-acyltransferase 2-A [Nematostella vectensis]EDO38372.1 predicted protein [Nematostella vectensis]|eukprot:XP_001630435.1 predicted protein [Nematostella vectensis]